MPLGRIEAANALPLPSFSAKFIPTDPSSGVLLAKPGGLPTEYDIKLEFASSIHRLDFESCFDLIACTSSHAYSASSVGWLPTKKRKEMRLPDLRYLLLTTSTSSDAPVEGFLSFMLTYEDGHEVIYCYEIHLSSQFQGCGVGKCLMELMEDVGRSAGVEKAMLTVFVENELALKFYNTLGYREDEYSPPPRQLRNGIIKKPTYVILSKALRR